MTFNRWIRQFLRREEHECLVDSINYPQMLSVSGYQTFKTMIEDPDLEIVELFDVEGVNPFSAPGKIGVTWMVRRSGYDRKEIFPLEAFVLARHHGIDDLEMALHIEPFEGGARISVCLSQENVDQRQAVKEWIKECDRRGNPRGGPQSSDRTAALLRWNPVGYSCRGAPAPGGRPTRRPALGIRGSYFSSRSAGLWCGRTPPWVLKPGVTPSNPFGASVRENHTRSLQPFTATETCGNTSRWSHTVR